MPTEKELIDERLKKREKLLDLGINPYPYRYEPKQTAEQIQSKYKGLKDGEETKNKVKIAGRIIGLRKMGKIAFMHLLDATGKVQAYFSVDNLGEKVMDGLKLLDAGDWIGVEGTVFKTKRGEVSVKVSKYELLCKSIRPLPEKWHGLKDIEQRYRKRYVDLIVNPEVRDTFIKRTICVNAVRETLNSKGFLEVDTPVLQPIYGGAAAKPFKTHLNALDMEVFLRISDELYLKRLIVGGFGKIYEFSKDFRNEDIDRTHNPEFTQVEVYQAYADYNDMKELLMDVYANVAKKIYGSTKFEYQGNKIDVKKPWKEYTMREALKKIGGIDSEKMSDDALRKECKKNKVEIDANASRELMIQELFEELCENKLIQPTIITEHPIESTPLCKQLRIDTTGKWVERFEPYIAGMEVGNAYSELNDPVKQRKLLEEQAKKLREGNEESHPMDEDFIQAIEVGMPPTGGIGISIDRMAMLMTNSPSIRDVLFFPFMKQNE
ncbi:lysine--tRNA ligase [Candidatus Woesearchaeota archaeon]|nr:lysine--tRNA ligase [Candidatus Woesearchaeota archaeon]